MLKRIGCLFLSLLLVCSIVGCDTEEQKEGEYKIYYLNMDKTKIVPEAYDSSGVTGEALAMELLERLQTVPDSSKLYQTIPGNVTVNGVKSDGIYLTVDFGEKYKELSVLEEVLIRAAVVYTLLQIPEYSLVSFTINAEPLRENGGSLIGNMTADSFVDNPGAQINTSIQSTLKLYFSNEEGTALVEETRIVTHSSSVSLEKLVMEQLIEGTTKSKSLSTIPSATKVIHISVADGVCYVNLDQGFQNQNLDIREEIVLYSIVNSLTELSGVQKVQLSINGKTNGFCRYTYPLSQMYEKDLTLLGLAKTEGAK